MSALENAHNHGETILPHSSGRLGKAQRDLGESLEAGGFIMSSSRFLSGKAQEFLGHAVYLLQPAELEIMAKALKVGETAVSGATHYARGWTGRTNGRHLGLGVYLPKIPQAEYLVTAVGEHVRSNITRLQQVVDRRLDHLLQIEQDLVFWDAFCKMRLDGSAEASEGIGYNRKKFERLYVLLQQEKKVWGTQEEINLDLIFGR
jgi:hypothetical protein